MAVIGEGTALWDKVAKPRMRSILVVARGIRNHAGRVSLTRSTILRKTPLHEDQAYTTVMFLHILFLYASISIDGPRQ